MDAGSGADMITTATAAIVVDAWAGVMVQRDCKSSSGCCGFKKEKHILSMPGELSEGSNFAVLGEVELEGTRELVLAIYKNYQVITYIWVAEPTRETV